MSTLTIKHLLEIPAEPNDLIQLSLEYVNGSTIRGRITGNGKVNSFIRPNSPTVNAVSFFLAKSPEEMASLFDTVGTLANSIDGDWLCEQLLKKLETSDIEDKESMTERIKRLSPVTNLMVLHGLGNEVMSELLGHNWVAEHSGKLVKHSRAWKALVNRVQVAQEALKDVLPT